MIWIILTIAIVGIGLFLLARRSDKGKPPQEAYPYQKSAALFTPAERSFLGVLQQAVGNNAAIFGKVRVADVVEPKSGLTRSTRQKAFNRISAKHFDFLLCDKEDLSVACAIELDDGSHNSKRRQERDEFLKGVCEAAGVPLIRISEKSGFVLLQKKHLSLLLDRVKYKPSTFESTDNSKILHNFSAFLNSQAVIMKNLFKKIKISNKTIMYRFTLIRGQINLF
ncbi:MAG: DUF2726 domain-containing protein [Desulfobacterales bacterium]|jgi:hypothetical protein|nr:DUF2726 domain-containing protein [Desulfobacterales bacterium]